MENFVYYYDDSKYVQQFMQSPIKENLMTLYKVTHRYCVKQTSDPKNGKPNKVIN